MIGQFIHNYQISQRLGEGGMGIVYKASDTVLGREVALKMLHGQLIRQSQFLDRFKKEARVLAQLLHPNIAVIYNFIEQDDNHFMVMEYVQGKNLDELLKQQYTIAYENVVAIFLQALEGLQHAHKKGIYHRDIKPSNFILSPDGTVKLMDFGIAKFAGEQRLTQVNRVVGTIEYMAPELIEGKDPSTASDIYAAGVTMYELLSGRLPFQGNTDFTLMKEILKTRPGDLDKLNTSIPKALSAIVMKSLEKIPENRYEDAKTFRNAILQAFPASREIDLSRLIKQAAPATIKSPELAVNTQSAIRPTTILNSPATEVQYTISLVNRILSFVDQRKWYFAALLLFMAIGIGAVVRKINSPDTNDVLTKPEPGDSLLTKFDTVNGSNISNNRDVTNNKDRTDGKVPTPDLTTETQVILPENKPQGEKRKKEKNTQKSNPGKEEINIANPVQPNEAQKQKTREFVSEPGQKSEEEPEKKDSYKPARKPKNSVTIEDRLRIEMRLRDRISESAVQQGQSLSFVVEDPVRYSGHIIVAGGATANGYVKSVNGTKISVVISSVRTVDGQIIEFQERDANLGGNIFKTGRCWAITRKGFTIIY